MQVINLFRDLYKNGILQQVHGEIKIESTITYDINDDITYTLAESWYSNTWNNGANYTYTYDINHNQLSVIAQNWNAKWRMG
jgi:hypothetical protein